MSDPILLLLVFGIPMIGQLVSAQLQRKFSQFSQDPLRYRGREIAEMMLRDNGIHDVQVISTAGRLTDHYNPSDKTVNLSQVVYEHANVAAAAVAAHECGHAVQHANNYPLLAARSKLVPLLKISSIAMPVIAIGGAVVSAVLGETLTAYVFIGVLGLPALFSLVTLPVEFDASRRALAWMNSSGMAAGQDYTRARKALWWAAMTYVVGAVAAIAQVMYFARMFLGRSQRR